MSRSGATALVSRDGVSGSDIRRSNGVVYVGIVEGYGRSPAVGKSRIIGDFELDAVLLSAANQVGGILPEVDISVGVNGHSEQDRIIFGQAGDGLDAPDSSHAAAGRPVDIDMIIGRVVGDGSAAADDTPTVGTIPESIY